MPRTWPALELHVRSDPDLLQAALVDYEIAAIDDNTPEIWRVFFHTAEERDRARRGLASDFPEVALSSLEVPDEDWAARSQASLRAIQVGDIIVAPPWDIPEVRLKPDTTYDNSEARLKPDTTDDNSEARLKPGSTGQNDPTKEDVVPGFSRAVIVIQPSMGFGTGHHATTRLCLAALQQLEVSGQSAIDVGTGSGVLAIAASLLGAAPVVAIDDDPDAIHSARENMGLNPAAIVHVRRTDLRSGGLAAFDIVMANLTGGLLIQAAERLHDLTAASGRLILSGFTKHEEAAVLDAFAGYASEQRAEEDEWLCVTLRKP